jgi:hypothetical protein
VQTGSAGTCAVSKAKIANATTEVTFTVTGLTYPTGTYVPGANHDPDGDSDGTSIQIAR